MNKKASVLIEILIFLVAAVFLSATILFLVKSGIIQTKSSYEEVNVLNTEFLPMGRGGTLALKQFDFCGNVDEKFNCFVTGEKFQPGDNIYVRFLVESSTYNGEIMLVRNYQIKDNNGEIILQVDEKNNYHFSLSSSKEKESIAFADFFTTSAGFSEGAYTLDVIIENPLLNKKITLSKKFVLQRAVYDDSGEWAEE